jgi:hypothetical protein
MTRREIWWTPFALAAAVTPPTPLAVPVHHVLDGKAQLSPEQIRYFWSRLWPEACRDFARCGIRFESSVKTAGIWRPSGREPVIYGLDRGVINLVITDRIPLEWANGSVLSGVTTLYRGYHVCMVALNRAHGHQVPFLSTNTCVHELLHALMHDIFEGRPGGLNGAAREFRIDLYATRLWLFHDGSAIRGAAESYLRRVSNDLSA